MAKEPVTAHVDPTPAVKRTRKPSNIPANETPAQRFRRVAAARAAKAIAALDTLAACFDTRSYEWTEDQANKVIAALEKTGGNLAKKAKNPAAGSGKQDSFDF